MNRVLVVAPQEIGIDNNSPAISVARRHASLGDQVRFCLGSVAPFILPPTVQESLSKDGISFLNVYDTKPSYKFHLNYFFRRLAKQVTEVICEGYDLVYFVGPLALGFDFVRRRQFRHLSVNPRCVSLLCSPLEWKIFHSKHTQCGQLELSQLFAERYVAEHSDGVLVIDSELQQFLNYHGWKWNSAPLLYPDSDAGLHDIIKAIPAYSPLCQNSFFPEVDLCIPHYNHGDYLPAALASIEEQTYANLNVFIVDDASSEAHSRQVFEDLRKKYASNKRWHFIRQKKRGQSEARNRAAELGQGDYLLFFDADNLARPKMVERFVEAMERTRYDCLTCYVYKFTGDAGEEYKRDPEQEWLRKPEGIYTPLGNAPALGMQCNVFGDMNFIIKRKVFNALGGILSTHLPGQEIGYVDYAFLARLCLEGYGLDVVPEELFFYRMHEHSVSSRINLHYSKMQVLGVYRRYLSPLHLGDLVAGF